MVRFHFKRVVVASVTLVVICCFILALLHQFLSEPYKDPEFDPVMFKRVIERAHHKSTVAHTTPPPKPQIHLKVLPPPVVSVNMAHRQLENQFFKYLEFKAVRCENDQRLGNQHDGGWNVCLSPPFTLRQPCIVFSFGIGYDWQFDDAISKIYNCRVLAFDPSMNEPDSRRSHLIEFKRTGIGAQNEVNEKGWTLKTLGTHLQDEGFWGVPVDYVKIDIEYSEWKVLKTAFAEGALKNVKQLGFEIHTKNFIRDQNQTEKARFEKLSPNEKEMEEKLDIVHMYETLHQVEIQNFRKFNYRKNPFGNYRSTFTRKERSCCYELHYVNLDFIKPYETVVHEKDAGIFH